MKPFAPRLVRRDGSTVRPADAEAPGSPRGQRARGPVYRWDEGPGRMLYCLEAGAIVLFRFAGDHFARARYREIGQIRRVDRDCLDVYLAQGATTSDRDGISRLSRALQKAVEEASTTHADDCMALAFDCIKKARFRLLEDDYVAEAIRADNLQGGH